MAEQSCDGGRRAEQHGHHHRELLVQGPGALIIIVDDHNMPLQEQASGELALKACLLPASSMLDADYLTFKVTTLRSQSVG